VLRWASILVVLTACGGTSTGTDPKPDTPPAGDKKRIVILMIGDGMGRGQRDAASHFAHGAAGKLFLESLPARGTIITSGPSGTTDSAAAATTMATGRRAFNGAIGLDRAGVPAQTVVELAHELGMHAGIVSTSAIPHATPGAFTAHRDSRHDLTEIASDQVLVVKPDVMLGGGAQYFGELFDDLSANNYTIARTADELAAASPSGKLAGIFANEHLEFTIARPAATTEPTLLQMSRVALDRLDAASPDGFFLMIEGSRIDMASHLNMLPETIGETNAFDDTVRGVVDWAAGRDDVTIIVTADHECGGLEVTQGNGAGALPDVRWRWGNHTNAAVGVYAQGPGSEVFDGTTTDHRYVHRVIESRLRGVPFEAPAAERIADGRLADVPHVAAMQANTSGFGAGYNQLDALHLGADDDALAIGVAGVFEKAHNAVVVLIDVDFGASTGPARMRDAISDINGVADGIVASLNLDAPITAGFGVDLVLVSHGAEDPMLEQTVTEAGLRGLRAPYGQPNNLGWFGAAMNFGDDTKSLASPALPLAPIAGRGFEAQIPWERLYPNGRPPGARLAIAAVLVNDDGGYTSNQALPTFPPNTPNPARAPTALPGIVVFTIDGNSDGVVDPITASTIMP
jgi:alkaline phosphatase